MLRVDLSIPFMGIWNGTSFAAPIVTGILARLFQEFPILKISPASAMALLAASADFWSGMSVGDPTYREIFGCGRVNYARARTARVDRMVLFGTGIQKGRYNIEGIERGDRKKASICWLAPSTGAITTAMPDLIFTLATMDMEFNPSDNLFISQVQNGNIQTIKGEIEADGIVQFRAFNYDAVHADTNVGIAIINDG